MANYKRCPQGHMYDADLNPVCPLCPPPAPQQNKLLTIIPWVAFGAALMASVFLFGAWSNAQEEIDAAQQSLEETQQALQKAEETAAKYSELEANFGYGSENYFADKPIVLLKAGGAAETITIHWKDAGTASFQQDNKNIKIKWAEKFHDNRADVSITPSASAGYCTVHFSNNVNDDAFDVLVVVN